MTTMPLVMNSMMTKLTHLARRQLAAESPSAFASVYLAHHFNQDRCAMHTALFDTLKSASSTRGRRIAIAAPRGHAKSTIVSLAYPLWCMMYGLEPYIVLVSDTGTQAAQNLRNIRVELETNELLTQDFPHLLGRRAKPWREDAIELPGGTLIVAKGAGQGIRGTKNRSNRPSLILVDDLENRDEVVEEIQRDKLRTYFYGTLLKLGDSRTNVVVVGTVLHHDALLARLVDPNKAPGWDHALYRAIVQYPERMDLWEKWGRILSSADTFDDLTGERGAARFLHAHHEEMHQGAEVLWPQRESLEALMKLRITEESGAFEAEKQNQPLDPEMCVFDPEQFTFWDDKFSNFSDVLARLGDQVDYFGAWDPALGGRRGDHSAIIVLAACRNRDEVYVVEADVRRRTPDDAINHIVNLAKVYPFHYFMLESNNFQGRMARDIYEVAAKKGVSIRVQSQLNTMPKHARISMLEPHINSGRIRLSRRHAELLAQLRQFPLGRHDDGPDAMAMAFDATRSERPRVHVSKRD
jgi:predicted phage terminase large subunit-like protein